MLVPNDKRELLSFLRTWLDANDESVTYVALKYLYSAMLSHRTTKQAIVFGGLKDRHISLIELKKSVEQLIAEDIEENNKAADAELRMITVE